MYIKHFDAGGKTEKDHEKILGLIDCGESKADFEYGYKLEKALRTKQCQN